MQRMYRMSINRMRLSVSRRQSRNSSPTMGNLERVLALMRTGCLRKAWGGFAKRAVVPTLKQVPVPVPKTEQV